MLPDPVPRIRLALSPGIPAGPAMPDGLAARIALMLGALLVFRLGTHVPLPGIDLEAWQRVFVTRPDGITGTLSLLSGGGLDGLSVLALGIVPYVAAFAFVQLMTAMSCGIATLRRAGEHGRRTINHYARYLAIVLACFQAYALAVMIEGAGAAVTPGPLFRISTVATLTGGAVFLIWLAERITARGLGNGMSLIMFCGIAAQLPPALTALLEQDRQGLLPPGAYFWQILAAAALAGVIVFVELAERRVPLQMANAAAARGAPAYLSLKVNAGGCIPPVCAIALLTVPVGLLPGPATMLLLLALIVGLAFLFPRIALAPSEAAAELRSRGAVIPRIPAGDSTAAHLGFIQIRMATIGAMYLGVICLVPMLAASWMPAWPRLATLDLFTSAGNIRHPPESPSR